jgi:holliday junction DNA helicase RuvA
MIANIHGKIIATGEDYLVIDVGGIGFRVFVTTGLSKKVNHNEVILLFTHLIVREDLLSLYGFETEEERNFFILLLGVNGVGPRTSLAMLSTLSIDVMRRAVLSEQADIFSRVPGVGKKTAQKILLHLDGKVGSELTGLAGTPGRDSDTEVLEALTALGYSVIEAQAALQSLPRDAPEDVETRLRLALQYFTS